MIPIVWEVEDRFPISGRGCLMTGRYPFTEPPAEVIGRELLVDGEVWIVAGTETIRYSSFSWPGIPCGLLLTKKELPMDDDEEEGGARGQWNKLEKLLPNTLPPPGAIKALNEAMYTFSETHSEDSGDPQHAILMWRMVEWAIHHATPEQIEAIRL